MSGPFPPASSGGGNPFENLFAQLGRLFSAEGPVNWELARQLAQWAAAEGAEVGNVDPLERMRLEELVRVADLQVADVTGLSTSTTGRAVTVRPVNRPDWATATLEAWKPLLTALAVALQPEIPGGSDLSDPSGLSGLAGLFGPTGGDDPSAPPGDPASLLGPLLPALQSAFLGMQAGSMVGSLAQRALGQYDLPIPRPPSDEVLVVAQNVSSFAADWSLPVDDVRLWVCLSEVAHHAVLGRPHVREALDSLLMAYVSGFDPSAASLEERLAGVDPTDPSSLQDALGDPGALLGEIQTDEQRRLQPRLEALVAVIEGYVDHVVDVAGSRLMGSHGQLTEALRRRRVERGQGERMIERLLGVELREEQYALGTTFVSGVVERAGDGALARLWTEAHALPTPAEVAAPGLWLERIDLPR